MIKINYVPTEWKTGDVITADKLNNIEQGIVNAGGAKALIVNCSNLPDKNNPYTTPTLDKTFDEIASVISGGGTILISLDQQTSNSINSCTYSSGISSGGGANVQYITFINNFVSFLENEVTIANLTITASKLSGESGDAAWSALYKEITLSSNS